MYGNWANDYVAGTKVKISGNTIKGAIRMQMPHNDATPNSWNRWYTYTYTKPSSYTIIQTRIDDTIAADGSNVKNKVFANIATSNSYKGGGAICNTQNLSTVDIVADFIGNSMSASGSGSSGFYNSYGGAIYNSGSLNSINGNFIGNSGSGSTRIVSGFAIYNEGTIGSIIGNFFSNSSADSTSYIYGAYGTIYNKATIGSIVGDFVGNSAYADNDGWGIEAHGGAIYNIGTIDSIVGDFIANRVVSIHDSSISGGAIHNGGTISSITGDFINNFMSGTSSVYGGAIYNYEYNVLSTISITGDFIGNCVKATNSNGSAYGGAIFNGSYPTSYNPKSVITLAGNTFTGNYTQVGTNDPVPNSIYNAGKINIANGTTVTINDGYDGLAQAQLNIGTDSIFNLSVDNGTIQTDNLGTVTNNGTINWDLDVDLLGTYNSSTPTSDNITVNSLSGTQSIIINAINLITGTGDDEINVTLTDNATLMAAYTLSGSILTNISKATGVDYDVQSVDYNPTTGILTFNKGNTPIVLGNATIDRVHGESKAYLGETHGTYTLTETTATATLAAGEVRMFINGKYYKFTPNESASGTYTADDMNRMVTNLAHTGFTALTDVGSTGNYVFYDGTTYWGYTPKKLPLSVWDPADGTSSAYDYYTYAADNTTKEYHVFNFKQDQITKNGLVTLSAGTSSDYDFIALSSTSGEGQGGVINHTKYYNISIDPTKASHVGSKLSNINWSKSAPSGYTWADSYAAGSNVTISGGTITGAIRMRMPHNGSTPTSWNRYFTYTYTKPSTYSFINGNTSTVSTPSTGTSSAYIIPTGGRSTNVITNAQGATISTGNAKITNKVYANNVLNGSFYSFYNIIGGSAILNQGTIGNVVADFVGNRTETTSNGNDTGTYTMGGAVANIARTSGVTASINSITGDFVGNSVVTTSHSFDAYGGAIANFANSGTATIGSIVGDFVGNSATRRYAYGGAISNHANSGTATIGSIVGDFVGNSSYSLQSNGGAIFNQTGSIGSITGDFIGNSAISINYPARGGAIYNYGIINSITGDFIGNSAISTDYYTSGGAIYNTVGTIGSITGDFVGNRADYGGAIYINGDDATIDSIVGDFIGNSFNSANHATSGGAIYIESGSIGSITGDFIGNFASSNGGAIYNSGKINSIVGNFVGNSTINIGTGSTSGRGGAIYVLTGSIGSITGDFIGNIITSSNSTSPYGGAIYNDNSTIGSITGDFVGNRADFGGAIYNNGVFNSITGDFIGNSATRYGYTYGGAIYNDGSGMGSCSIEGDFVGNSITSTSSQAWGGAIYSRLAIGSITGDFVGNSATSSTSSAYGGAIYGGTNITNANFLNNYAQTTGGTASGGAIYVMGNMTLIADGNVTKNGGISTIRGNYISNDNGETKNYEAIYVARTGSGSSRNPYVYATLTFNAKNSGRFIIDDYVNVFEDCSLTFTGDSTGKVDYNNVIKGTSKFTVSNVDFNWNTTNGTIDSESFKTITITTPVGGAIKRYIDVDLVGTDADKITASSTVTAGAGSILINAINLITGTGDAEVNITLTNNATLRTAYTLSSDILGNITKASGVSYDVQSVEYNKATGILTFNKGIAPIILGNATIDRVHGESKAYLAETHGTYTLTETTATAELAAGEVRMFINGKYYKFTPNESASGTYTAADMNRMVTNLAHTGYPALKNVGDSGNWVFYDGTTYWGYSRDLPQSVWKPTDGTSSAYDYYTYAADNTTKEYHKFAFKDGGKIAWVDNGSTATGTYANDNIAGSNVTISGDTITGAIRMRMPHNGVNPTAWNRYFTYTYAKPTGYEFIKDKISNVSTSSSGYTGAYEVPIEGRDSNVITNGIDVTIPSGTASITNKTYANNILNANFNHDGNIIGGSSVLNQGTIGNIISDFMGNKTISDSQARDGYAVATVANISVTSGKTANIDSITGDFIGNYNSVNSPSSTGSPAIESLGGAISNFANYGTVRIGSIVGNFVGNSATANYLNNANGGAIANYAYRGTATIDSIAGDFVGNSISSTNSFSFGGAISNYASHSTASIGSIVGDFVGNSANSSNTSNGGAIYNYTDYNSGSEAKAKIDSIVGNFVGNSINSLGMETINNGGAIANAGIASIGSIVGDFIGNFALASSSYSTARGGAICNYGDSASIGSIVSDFVGNNASSLQWSAYGGAIYNIGTMSSIDGDFIDNYAKTSSTASNAYGGAIFNGSSPTSFSSSSVITLAGNIFTDNYVQVGETITPNSIYNAGVINIADGATVTINDGYQSLSNAQLKIGTSSGSGSVFNLNIGQGTIQTDSLGQITNNGTINATFDINFASATSHDKVSGTGVNSGTVINVTDLNILNPDSLAPGSSTTRQILLTSDNNLQLALGTTSKDLGTGDFEYNVNVAADNLWTDVFGHHSVTGATKTANFELATTSTDNDSIAISISATGGTDHVTSFGDSLKLVNNNTTYSPKTFTAAGQGATYNVTDNLGATKGTVNVNGIEGGAVETVDIKNFTGFEVGTGATALNFNNVTVGSSTATNPTLVTVSNANATIGLNNATMNGAITGSGTTQYNVTSTGTNTLKNVTDARVANSGTLSLSGTNNLVNITNTSGSTTITGGTTTSGAITQNAVTISGGKLIATNGITTTTGVTNSVKNGLEVQGGTINSNISGTGSTKINTTGTVTNNGTTSQTINLAAGTFNTNAAGIGGGLTVTSGTVELTGGTLDTAITGSGITDIKAGTGTVTVGGGSIGNNVTISSGTLASDITKLGGTITNNATFNMSGNLSKNIGGATTGTTVLQSDTVNVANTGIEVSGILDVNGKTIAMSDAYETLTVGKLKGNGNLTLYVNANTDKADEIHINNSGSNSVLTITTLNLTAPTDTAPGVDSYTYTKQILTGTTTGTSLVLGSGAVASEYNVVDKEISRDGTTELHTNAIAWNDNYGGWTQTGLQNNKVEIVGTDTIKYSINKTWDPAQYTGKVENLAIMNSYTGTGSDNRSVDFTGIFNTPTSGTYTVASNLGSSSAGTYTLNGVKGGTSGTTNTTVDLKNHSGFVLDKATTLEFNNIDFKDSTNANATLITVSSNDADINLNNSNIQGAITRTGDVTYDISATNTNSLQNVTGARVANSGSLSLSGTNNLVNITNNTGSTTVTAGTTTSGAITQNAVSITGGKLVATNGITTTTGITNNVSNGLEVQGGTINSNISGSGTTNINTTGTVTNNGTISQAINLTTGTFNTSASGIGGDLDVTAGTVELTGGTLDTAITGSGITDIKAGTGTVTVGGGSIGNNVTISSGTLASDITKLGGTITNNATFNMSGNLSKNIGGATTGTTVLQSDTVNVANTGIEVSGILDVNGKTIAMGDNAYETLTVGNLTNNGNLTLDVDARTATGNADEIHINNTGSNTQLTITALNILQPDNITGDSYTYEKQILTGENKAGVTLALASGIGPYTEAISRSGSDDLDTNTIKWDKDYGGWTQNGTRTGVVTITSSSGTLQDQINYTATNAWGAKSYTSKVENLAIMNQYTGAGSDDRTVDFDGILTDPTAQGVYTVTDDLGTTNAGKYSLLGETDGETKATVDFDGHSGFVLSNNNTELVLKDLEVKNSSGLVSGSAGENVKVVLDNVNLHDNGTGIKTNGDIEIKGNSTISDDIKAYGANSKIDVDGTDEVTLDGKMVGSGSTPLNMTNGTINIGSNAKIMGMNATMNDTTLNLASESALSGLNTTFNGTNNLNMSNGSVGTLALGNVNLNGLLKMQVDADLANKQMDKLTATNATVGAGGAINVDKINLLSPTTETSLKLLFTNNKDLAKAVSYTGEGTIAYSPIYKYKTSYEVEQDMGYFKFGLSGGPSPSPDNFNPAVLSTPAMTQAGMQANMNTTMNYAFQHSDGFTKLKAMDRFSAINANKYALAEGASTDFNQNMSDMGRFYENKGVWARPYASFENVPLKNGPRVDAISYGTLVGFDTDFKELKHGWDTVFTGYLGYNGAHLNYTGVTTTMNGGILGGTQTWYKGNFWTALTATTGASVAENDTMYGHESNASIMAGVGSKTGYNFEFNDGRFIVQPIWFMSYSMMKTFDYTNAAGVRVDSDPLHTIQLNPSVRFIGNLNHGWQPYASVGMVWNLMNETKAYANGVKLPEMSIKPYVEYGVGVQKQVGDRFTGFFQAMMRNGGRNGIALTGGFRWALGRDSKPVEKVQGVNIKQAQATSSTSKVKSDKKVLKQVQNDKSVQNEKKQPSREKADLNGKKVQFVAFMDNPETNEQEKKVLKQLSPTQKARLTNNGQ